MLAWAVRSSDEARDVLREIALGLEADDAIVSNLALPCARALLDHLGSGSDSHPFAPSQKSVPSTAST
jgi:hypothetical protein